MQHEPGRNVGVEIVLRAVQWPGLASDCSNKVVGFLFIGHRLPNDSDQVVDRIGGVDLLVEELLDRRSRIDFHSPSFAFRCAGLQRLAPGGIDIVLLDLNLPDSRGLETFVKLHAEVPDVPVVVLIGDARRQRG